MPDPFAVLVCPTCSGFVHPFLDACPGCGTARVARYDEAVAGPDLGYRKLLEEPRVANGVAEVVLRYTLKHLATTGPERLRDGLGIILDALPYAITVVGPAPASSSRGHVELAPDDLVAQERSPAREVARIPLRTILAIRARGDAGGAGSWAGLTAFGRHDDRTLPDVDGDLVVTFAGDGGPGRLVLANRRGFAAVKARSDHYVIAGRGLAILAAAAAEARWIDVGAARYAAELGLTTEAASAASAAEAPGSGAGGPGSGAGWPGSVAIADALATLEDLRARGLVTETEYAEKRREILSRL